MSADLFSHMFKSLVAQVGGVEAAGAAISAAVGHAVSIGTVSRIANGNAEVPMVWAYALEDATGNRCFSNYRQRQVTALETEKGVDDHLQMLRESSEWVEAVARAEVKPSRDTIVRARKETADVHEQSGRALSTYDQMLADMDRQNAAGAVPIKRGIA